MSGFAIAVLALGVVNSVLLVILAVRRTRLARSAHRQDEVATRLRPRVLAFLEGDEELPEMTRGDRQIVAGVLGGYGRMVRGPARARITAYFEEHGDIDNELHTLASNRAAWRRASAAYRLGDVGAASAEPGLIQALHDPDRDVRAAATRSLGRVGTAAAIAPLISAVADGRIATGLARWAALQVGPPALPELRNLLAAEDPNRRAGAVMLIGQLGDAADAETIAGHLRDSSAIVRRETAHALGRLGSERNIPRLVAALSDRVPGVRAAAAAALGRLRADASAPLLLIADHDQFDVARAAAYAAVQVDLPAAVAAAQGYNPSPHLLEAIDEARLG